ncbi:hypothetical protein LTS17_000968 [Exophiala oligosperma]
MVTLILLNPALDTPISYLWGHDQYEVCVDCVRARECRTCDGETKTTFKLCEVHRDIDEETYDVATLDDIRDKIYPLYSSLPGSNEKRKSILKNLKVVTVSRPTPFWRRRTPAIPNNTTTIIINNNNNNKEAEHDDDDDDPLPIPIITYVHGKGCIFSDSPDVVIKPAEFVKAIDDLAKTRHDKLTKILDERVSQPEHQPPVTDTGKEGCAGGGRAHAGSTSSASLSSDTATTTATVSLSSGLSTCSTEDSKTNKKSHTTVTTTSWEEEIGSESDYGHETYYERRQAQEAKEEAEVMALIARLAAEETTRRIRDEKARLEACMATSGLAKGLYFKRCNGMFRNALDDELLLPLSPSTCTSTAPGVDTSTARKGIESIDVNKNDSSKSTTTTLATDMVTTTTKTIPPVSDGAGAGAGAGECTLSGAGYSLLAHQENIHTFPASSTTESDGDDDDEDDEDDNDTFYDAIERARANPQIFKFITPVLMSREALVRDGKVEAGNLEKASWSFNNLERRARRRRRPPPPSSHPPSASTK